MQNETITITLTELNKLISSADRVLDEEICDSNDAEHDVLNDAEHDVLYDIRQTLTEYRRTRKSKRITCGYCGESYVADGGWHCPHCGGC